MHTAVLKIIAAFVPAKMATQGIHMVLNAPLVSLRAVITLKVPIINKIDLGEAIFS